MPGHCDLKKLEQTVKAALAARQCSVSAASFSEGSLILRERQGAGQTEW